MTAEGSTVLNPFKAIGKHIPSIPKFSRNSESKGDADGQTSSVRDLSPQTQPQTINVVLFGETGVGKSSVINLIAQKSIAKVSSDVDGCTMQYQRYDISFDNSDFAVFDTIGLEEPQMGVNGYLKAIEKAYELIGRLSAAGGIHLLLFCMRGGRITATTQSNYRLFCECLCSTKVPIALVFTGLEREVKMEDWWDRNKKHIEGYGIKSDGHACITAVQDDTPGEEHKYMQSRETIRKLLKDCALKGEAFSLESHSWFARTLRGLRSFVPSRKGPKKKDIMKVLTHRCKLDAETARRIADMMEKDDTEKDENKDLQADAQVEKESGTNEDAPQSEHDNSKAVLDVNATDDAGTMDNTKNGNKDPQMKDVDKDVSPKLPTPNTGRTVVDSNLAKSPTNDNAEAAPSVNPSKNAGVAREGETENSRPKVSQAEESKGGNGSGRTKDLANKDTSPSKHSNLEASPGIGPDRARGIGNGGNESQRAGVDESGGLVGDPQNEDDSQSEYDDCDAEPAGVNPENTHTMENSRNENQQTRDKNGDGARNLGNKDVSPSGYSDSKVGLAVVNPENKPTMESSENENQRVGDNNGDRVRDLANNDASPSGYNDSKAGPGVDPKNAHVVNTEKNGNKDSRDDVGMDVNENTSAKPSTPGLEYVLVEGSSAKNGNTLTGKRVNPKDGPSASVVDRAMFFITEELAKVTSSGSREGSITRKSGRKGSESGPPGRLKSKKPDSTTVNVSTSPP